MYLNTLRIQAGHPTPLNDNDEICFGRNVANNELKYKLFLRDGKASLERSTESFTGAYLSPRRTPASPPGVWRRVGSSGGSESTPPTARTPRRATAMQQCSARKRLKLTQICEASDPTTPMASSSLSPTHLSMPSSSLPSYQSPAKSCKALFTNHPHSSPIRSSQPTQVFNPHSSHGVTPHFSPNHMKSQVLPTLRVVSSPSRLPGPSQGKLLSPWATPVSPTKSIDEELDDLLQDIVSNSDTSLLDGAVKTVPHKPIVPCGGIPSTTSSTTAADKDVDDLFEDIIFHSDSRLLDEVSAVNTTPVSTPVAPTVSTPAIPAVCTTPVSTPVAPTVSTPAIPAVSTPAFPAPAIPAVSTPAIPAGSTLTAPAVSTPAIPAGSTPAGPTSTADQDVEDIFDDIAAISEDRLLQLDGAVKTTPPIPSSLMENEMEDLLDSISEDTLNEVETTPLVPPADTALSNEVKEPVGDTIEDRILDGGSSPARVSPVSTTLPEDEALEDLSQQSKDQLLSSIEALKNELATKNELINKQKQKTDEDTGGVVSSMTQEFLCVICHELFINAHTLLCSHSFCEVCIKGWIKTKKECPICRKQITSVPVRTLALDNAIATVESKLSPEEKKGRDEVKEERKTKLGEVTNTPTSSSGDLPSTSHLSTDDVSDGDSLDYLTPGSVSSDEEPYDTDYEEYGIGEVYFSGFSAGYGGFGRCYHCGKWDK